MDELKPCPFCGGKAEVLYTGKYECFVHCRRGCVEQTRLYKAKGSAVKAWNRRKEAPETKAAVHGEWIDDYDPVKFGEFRYKCSKCGARTVEWADNFCYQCGADMRGGEEEAMA